MSQFRQNATVTHFERELVGRLPDSFSEAALWRSLFPWASVRASVEAWSGVPHTEIADRQVRLEEAAHRYRIAHQSRAGTRPADVGGR